MKKLLVLFSLLVSGVVGHAASVPDVDVCGTLVSKGKLWNGDERLQRIIRVSGEEMGIDEFYLRYCQSRNSEATDTCKRALIVARLDLATVSRNMPKGLCKE